MRYMNHSDFIKVIRWDAPKCRCSDCIQHPASSHGIHAIGSYQFPTLLSKRGNSINPQSVDYRWVSPSGGERGLSTAPIVKSDDDRVWSI